LFGVTFPIVLYKEIRTDFGKMVMVAFAIGLLVIMVKELVQYYLEYPKVKPFTINSQLIHREISYALLFFFPIIISIWSLKKHHNIIEWIIFSFITLAFIVFIFATLARGAWVSLIAITLIILLLNRQWLVLLLSLIFSSLLFISATQYSSFKVIRGYLQNKLTQIDSGKRFEGGSEGSGLDLILEQPIKGYGYGNQVYHNIYNERVKEYPEWTFKKSIGPHNIFLAFWFAGGILGLFGILYFCSSMIAQGIQLIRKNHGIIRQASLVLLMSFLGVYVLRGLFENAYINQVGILVGLMLALRH
ncbi:O-antigen ligase RfaL, partial [Klebsiella variicola subsp. variicola]